VAIMPRAARAAARPALTSTPYKKKAIPNAVRREVALKYGCPPGGTTTVRCHYCPTEAGIHWWTKADGRPGYWVWFGHELHHLIPESLGGPMTTDNIVPACRPCNRGRGAKA